MFFSRHWKTRIIEKEKEWKKIYFSLLISYALPFFFSWLFRDSEESMFVYLCAMLIIRMCIVWCSICAYSTKNVKRQIKQNKIYDIPYAISNSVVCLARVFVSQTKLSHTLFCRMHVFMVFFSVIQYYWKAGDILIFCVVCDSMKTRTYKNCYKCVGWLLR